MLQTRKRFIYMVAMGIALSVIVKFFVLKDHFRQSFPVFHFIAIIIGTVIIWEGNLQIDHALNKHYSWVTNTKKRLVYQIAACFLYTLLILLNLLFIGHAVLDQPNEQHPKGIDPLFIIGAVVSFSALTIEITTQFFNAWKQSLLEVERYKTESANAQLQNLKSQLNPHFLFNNLSVLTSLVAINQDKAIHFINELSKAYRYLLDNKSAELVTLQEELAFLNHYTYLLKIRFENALSFLITIDEKSKQAYLPPLCLQVLVENTIQHNEASQANPLQVSIYTHGNTLCIENNIQPRTDIAASSTTGLQNIQSRYSFFTDEKIEISDAGKVFKVTLPLMTKQ